MKLFALAMASCVLSGCGASTSSDGAVRADRMKARAMQAMACVELERVPAAWRKTTWLPSGLRMMEVWQTISEEPLVDHGFKASAVQQRFSDQLFLVVQGGLPERLDIYGPLPQAPACV